MVGRVFLFFWVFFFFLTVLLHIPDWDLLYSPRVPGTQKRSTYLCLGLEACTSPCSPSPHLHHPLRERERELSVLLCSTGWPRNFNLARVSVVLLCAAKLLASSAGCQEMIYLRSVPPSLSGKRCCVAALSRDKRDREIKPTQER